MHAEISELDYVRIKLRNFEKCVTDTMIMATYRRHQKLEYQLQNGHS